MDALVAGLKQELEKAGQLDLSMASLIRAGEGEASTRASSVLSDASDGEEPASINGRIQQLMSKIHKDGIEVRSTIIIITAFIYSFVYFTFLLILLSHIIHNFHLMDQL